jgi:hypothetical protein
MSLSLLSLGWLKKRSPGTVARPGKKTPIAKVSRYRPALEYLEDRVAPAGANFFKTLATSVDAKLATVNISAISQATADLPILGRSLASQASRVNTMLNDIRSELKGVIEKLDPKWSEKRIEKELTTLLAKGVPSPVREVDVSGYNLNSGNITITARLGKSFVIPLGQGTFSFDLGLPAIPFNVTPTAR